MKLTERPEIQTGPLPRIRHEARLLVYLAGDMDCTVWVSPFTVTFCAAYLFSSASWKNEWLNYFSQSLLCTGREDLIRA